MNRNIPPNPQRGVSLIEGVLYLVIALAVIVGGIVFFQQAQLSNQVTESSRIAVSVTSELRGLYNNQRDLGPAETDLTELAIKSGAVPAQNINAARDAIIMPYGGEMRLRTLNSEDFMMTLTDVPVPVCMRLTSVNEAGEGPLGIGIWGVSIYSSSNTSSDLVAGAETTLDRTGPTAIPFTPVSAVGPNLCDHNPAIAIGYSR